METVSIEGPVRVAHSHPVFSTSDPVRLETVDYDPFDDVLEIRLRHHQRQLRLLLDDPQTIRLDPGETLQVIARFQHLEIRRLAVHRGRPAAVGWPLTAVPSEYN